MKKEKIAQAKNKQADSNNDSILFEEWVNELIKLGLYYPIDNDYYGKKNHLQINWVCGGITGGSCWSNDDSDHYAVEAETEPEFVSLDKIFEKYYPEIPWLKYKRFCQDNVETGDYSVGEYYGNSTNYATKSVDLYKLYLFFYENLPALWWKK